MGSPAVSRLAARGPALNCFAPAKQRTTEISSFRIWASLGPQEGRPRLTSTMDVPANREWHHKESDCQVKLGGFLASDVAVGGGIGGGRHGRLHVCCSSRRSNTRSGRSSTGSGFSSEPRRGQESYRGSYSEAGGGPWDSDGYSESSSRPLLEKGPLKDLKRIALTGVVLGLLTSAELALDGHLGGFVDGALSLMVQGAFALLLVDVSLTLATLIVNQLTTATRIGRCPWCESVFKFDRDAMNQLYMDTAMSGGQTAARMSCPHCFGELIYRGMDTEPRFAKGTDPTSVPGFGFKKQSWASDSSGKVVDVEAIVRDKD